jgi:hypothetical protein
MITIPANIAAHISIERIILLGELSLLFPPDFALKSLAKGDLLAECLSEECEFFGFVFFAFKELSLSGEFCCDSLIV